MQDKLNKILENYKKHEGNLISLLQDIQCEFGYISEEAVNSLAKKTEIPASNFFGVATFYSQFHLKPRGKNIITACTGTACHVKGADKLITGIQKEIGLSAGEDTTMDMSFTLEKVNCVGACSIAPVVIVNSKVVGKASQDIIVKEIKTLKDTRNEGK